MGFGRMLGRVKWNIQYLFGYWKYIDTLPEPDLANAINSNLRGGSILDLGCGTGNTVAALADYTYYEGVDLSAVAIRKARKRYANTKTGFVVANIIDFQPQIEFDVIVLSEVIYYIKPADVGNFLRRYKRSLKDGGVFVMRIWNVELKKRFVALIVESFNIIEMKPIADTELSVIITFN